MALSCSAPATACPNYPVQRHRVGHALEFVAAALIGDEQACGLTLHPRRDHDRTRFSERLRPCCDVWYVPEYFARRIDHHRTSVDGNTRGERWLAGAFILAIQFGE